MNASPVLVTPNITNPFHASLTQPLIDLDTAAPHSNNYKNDKNGNETNDVDAPSNNERIAAIDNDNNNIEAPISLPTNPFNIAINSMNDDSNANKINEKIHKNHSDTINNHNNANEKITDCNFADEKCKNKKVIFNIFIYLLNECDFCSFFESN